MYINKSIGYGVLFHIWYLVSVFIGPNVEYAICVVKAAISVSDPSGPGLDRAEKLAFERMKVAYNLVRSN